MNQTIGDFLFFGSVLSLVSYEMGVQLKKRFKLAIFNPLLISILIVMAFLSVFKINYTVYNESA
ncbi:MAG: LrgB family protein, partial [Paenibacillaceae bacterium]|nr:LrgB family protein [Paenibacillaceae bacterium]